MTMASQTSPMMAQFDNFDGSPAESFVSTPGDNYPSLFAATTPDTTNTVNPLEMMTPQSFTDEKVGTLSAIPEEESMTPQDDTASPTAEKKPTKKRKSWGQVLPEPKTNLPPRKRAKTDDEKEQRRVERVLRNRRAAQSSRERKRLEVEALEKRNRDLELALQKAQETNEMLAKELSRVRGTNTDGGIRFASPLDARQNSLTLSQELFSSQDSKEQSSSLIDDLLVTPNTSSNTNDQTVNPASLSPELGPVPEHTRVSEEAGASAAQGSQAASSDVTQHPAVMLFDLQCHTSEERLSSSSSQRSVTSLLAFSLQLQMMLVSASALVAHCHRPLMQIAMSLKAGSSILPTPQLLMTIIWLVTMTPSSTSRALASMISLTPTDTTPTRQTSRQRASSPLRSLVSTSRPMTLRFKVLRKILSSSPNLARPLKDATMEVLRLFSEERDDRVLTLWRETSTTRGYSIEQPSHLTESLPSKEVLLTLLWALQLEEKRLRQRRLDDPGLDPESGVPEPTTTKQITYLTSLGRISPRMTSGPLREDLK